MTPGTRSLILRGFAEIANDHQRTVITISHILGAVDTELEELKEARKLLQEVVGRYCDFGDRLHNVARLYEKAAKAKNEHHSDWWWTSRGAAKNGT